MKADLRISIKDYHGKTNLKSGKGVSPEIDQPPGWPLYLDCVFGLHDAVSTKPRKRSAHTTATSDRLDTRGDLPMTTPNICGVFILT